ncbi:MAG: tetratricopeptide repeat protein [Elusimicrobiota bacterium]
MIAESFAYKKLKKVMEMYAKGSYVGALKDINYYVKNHPDDKLGAQISDLVRKTLAKRHLKKAFTLKSEGFKQKADKELEKAIEYHSFYTRKIEKKYAEYLENNSPEKAANKVLYYMLKNPVPSDLIIYQANRKVRKRMAEALPDDKVENIKWLKDRVKTLREKKRWDEAVELISAYLKNNPENTQIKVLLSEINREAARHFYNQAVEYFEKSKIKQGTENAQISKKYDKDWYEKKLDSKLEEAKMNVAIGQEEQAVNQLEILSELSNENKAPSYYLDLFKKRDEKLIKNGKELYSDGSYLKAMVNFDFLRLREPRNKEAQLYYHLSAARKYIKENNLEKIKHHLIKALEISPGEKDALEIFDRLMDIIEVVGEG